MKQKFTALMLALAMVLALVPVASAASISSVTEPGIVYTVVGHAPVLPATVQTFFTDGTSDDIEVNWASISEDSYNGQYSSFIVSGNLKGYGRRVTVTVNVLNYTDEDMQEGLVLRYSFDSDADTPQTINDDSGNGYNGTVLNTSQQVGGGGRPGSGNQQTYTKNITIQDGVAVFPGAESVYDDRGRETFVNGAAIKIPEEARSGLEDYTVSMWVKVDSSYAFSQKMQRFFDFGIGTTNSIFLRFMDTNGGQIRFQDRGIAGGADDSNSYVAYYGVSSKMNDQWALLTVSYQKDASAATVFLNGKQIAAGGGKFTRSIGDIGALTDNNYGMFLGRTMWYRDGSAKSENPEFCGLMDDVRIYNRALVADEAMTLYMTTNPEADKVPERVITPNDVYTLVGEYPSLPSTVEVVYNNGSVKRCSVTWENISADKYSREGSFTVSGTAEGLTAEITVHVVDDARGSIESGMVANYTFDEDEPRPTVIKDMSGNGNDAIVLNNVSSSWGADVNNVIEIEDGAAVFPGFTQSSYWWGSTTTNLGAALQLPNDFNQGIDDYTISMWVNADGSYEYADKAQRFFDFGNRGNGGNDYYNSIFASYTANGGSYSQINVRDRKLNNGVGGDLEERYFTDRWGMLTLSYSKEEARVYIYINGERWYFCDYMTRGLDDLGTLTDASNGLYIGRNQWHTDYWGEMQNNPDFKGKMDNIRIYDRTLSEEEVAALYDDTNPERRIEVTVNTVVQDADGKVLSNTAETQEVPQNSRYSLTPDSTYIYNGVEYRLSNALSKLSISSVTDSDCTINIVYTIFRLESVVSPSVETYVGNAPVLPYEVEVTYQTGDTENAASSWDSIPADSYEKAGSFTVKGSVEGGEVTAAVTVYSIVSATVGEDVYTAFGERPSLPAAARVTFSHRPGETVLESVSWEEIPQDKIDSGKDFTVTGYLVNYPEVKVSATVHFVFEAKLEAEAVADTYTADGDRNTTRYGGEEQLMISSTGGGSSKASYNRYAFLRFENPGAGSALSAKLRLFMNRIDNGAYTEYTLYAMKRSDWVENDFIWSWQHDYIEGAEEIARASYRPSTNSETVNDWLVFDISEFIKDNPDKEYYDFYITATTCASYFSSREGAHPPVLEIDSEGKEMTVRYMADGNVIKSEVIAVPKNGSYTYKPEAAIIQEGRLYVSGGDVVIPDIAGADEIAVEMTEAEFTVENSVVTYYDEAPKMPEKVKIVWNGGEMMLPAEFDAVEPFGEIGTYTVCGTADGLEVPVAVKAYGRYYNDKGALLGYAGRVYVEYVVDGKPAADTVERLARVGTGFDAEAMTDYYPQIANGTVIEDIDIVTEPEHTAVISGTLVDGVSGFMDAKLAGEDPSAYTVDISAVAANTAESGSKAMIIIAKYDEEGKLISFKTDSADLDPEMTGRTELERTYDYNREAGEDLRIYLWDLGQVRPISEAIRVSELPDPQKYSDEIIALIPEYEEVKENVLRANDYRQSTWSYNTPVNGLNTAFWDTAAYHTGNMEVYKTFGGEAYLEYSMNWADSNEWKGNKRGGDPSSWTWGYDQDYNANSSAVLFGDWQICFQTYLDLYMIDPDRANIDRVYEVIDYQMSKDNDDFWWWADALYMVPPVFTKLYNLTGNEKYLDKLYEYYRFAAELMYDGEYGIPNEGEEYTSGAYNNKRDGSYFTDPDNYANLFFRDAGYVYPLNPNPGHADEKNFWARGNGWVFAGLAKILSDIPEDYEHRDFFVTIYNEMAQAIIDCQMQDDEGRGFWTQSMLQNYPTGNNGNDWGYETSGTAFLTYGLFWGLNNGMLDEDTYLEPALRGWKYLSEIALQENGKVGYCQPIGSNATQATAQSTDQPFGYGAFLLAGCETSRWVEYAE